MFLWFFMRWASCGLDWKAEAASRGMSLWPSDFCLLFPMLGSISLFPQTYNPKQGTLGKEREHCLKINWSNRCKPDCPGQPGTYNQPSNIVPFPSVLLTSYLLY